MSQPQDKAQMKQLLEGLSALEVRQLCIDALRGWRKKHPTESQVALHGALGVDLVPLLRTRGALSPTVATAAPHEAMIDAVTEPGMEAIAEFVGWFVRAGFAWALGAPVNGYPITLHLTKAGLRLVDSTADHPLLPGFVERIGHRCRHLPDDVLALLVDARSCLDHDLMRASIQLIGVAYEVAIEHVVHCLVSNGALSSAVANQKAALRIVAVKGAIDSVLPGKTVQEREDRFAVHAAYDFADQLRRRRNDAAHTSPKYDFDDRDEAEEFFVSAGRNLPSLWRMFRTPATTEVQDRDSQSAR